MQSPPFDFLQNSFFPVLKKMGIDIKAQIHQYGFYPAGGGKVTFEILPVKKIKPIELLERGAEKEYTADALFSGLSVDVPKRELKIVEKRMQWPEENLHLKQVNNAVGSGNVVFLKLEHEEITEIVTAFGVRGVSAEKVAELACNEARLYLESQAAVGSHLADQLLLPIALAGKGKFTTLEPSQHTITNIDVIQRFLSTRIISEKSDDNLWKISIGSQ